MHRDAAANIERNKNNYENKMICHIKGMKKILIRKSNYLRTSKLVSFGQIGCHIRNYGADTRKTE